MRTMARIIAKANLRHRRMCPVLTETHPNKMYYMTGECTMKKITSIILVAALALSLVFAFAGCSEKSGSITIAIPNDTTNEARALQLLEANGVITLKEGAGITATIRDVESNPHGITFREVEAAQLPNNLPDVDYAVINSNYAIDAGLNPVEEALAIEGSASAYGNILAVKAGNEQSPKTLALKAALESRQVADFITETYGGSVVSVVEQPTDGYDASVDYEALAGQTITVAASPAPHADILKVAREILAAKNVTLDIVEYTDYVVPNNVVDSGEIDANYFQHLPYLEDFNAQNGTGLVSVATIHVEPLGLYGGKQETLDALK